MKYKYPVNQKQLIIYFHKTIAQQVYLCIDNIV